MSVNQLVQPTPKRWLDGYIGGVIVDGSLTYDTGNMAVGDGLVLDTNKIARWDVPSYANSGSVFVGRLASTTLSTSVVKYSIAPLYPYPAIYSIVDGTDLTVSEAGDYVVISMLYSNSSTASIAQIVTVNSSSQAPSRQVSGPSAIFTVINQNNLTYLPVTLAAGQHISIEANSASGGAITTFGTGSFVMMMRVN